MTPEQLWETFIAHLNKAEPLQGNLPHKNFLGSIERYKRLFLEAAEEAYFVRATELNLQAHGWPDLSNLSDLFEEI